MIVAGEASGDQRGGEVVKALLHKEPKLDIFGIGGQDMRSAGIKTIYDVSDLAVMGFIEPLIHLPRILRIFKQMKMLLQTKRPDLLILVDYPGFNLRLAKVAKQLGIKVLFYISPQVWAWRQNRVRKIAQVVDHMAVIFPFETKFYEDHNVPVTYVGHPLSERITQAPTQLEARKRLAINIDKKIICLMPGSRNAEIKKLLPIMLDASKRIMGQVNNIEFVLPLASTIDQQMIEQLINPYNLPIEIANEPLTALSAADAVVTASGTATLETALLNKPMVIIYKVNRLTAMIAKRVIKIPAISLCNIVAEQMVVRELLQDDANPDTVSQEIIRILQDEQYRNDMIAKLKQINQKLGKTDAADNVANIALKMLSE